MKRLAPLAWLALTACGGSSPPPPPPPTVIPVPPSVAPVTQTPAVMPRATPDDAVLRAKLAQFVPAVITADVITLPPSEKKALDATIAAARLLDPSSTGRAGGQPRAAAQLAADPSEHGGSSSPTST